MICIYCRHPTSVVNSRHNRRDNKVWRRRRCETCGAVFTSIERPEYASSFVVQKSNSQLTSFVRDKLFVSIFKSCGHRPDPITDAMALTDTVLSKIPDVAKDGLIPASKLTALTLSTLKRFDTAAAVQYEAFHPLR